MAVDEDGDEGGGVAVGTEERRGSGCRRRRARRWRRRGAGARRGTMNDGPSAAKRPAASVGSRAARPRGAGAAPAPIYARRAGRRAPHRRAAHVVFRASARRSRGSRGHVGALRRHRRVEQRDDVGQYVVGVGEGELGGELDGGRRRGVGRLEGVEQRLQQHARRLTAAEEAGQQSLQQREGPAPRRLHAEHCAATAGSTSRRSRRAPSCAPPPAHRELHLCGRRARAPCALFGAVGGVVPPRPRRRRRGLIATHSARRRRTSLGRVADASP